MKYWQKRNIDLYNIAKQLGCKIDDLLEMACGEYYMTAWTVNGYNEKVAAAMEKKTNNSL